MVLLYLHDEPVIVNSTVSTSQAEVRRLVQVFRSHRGSTYDDPLSSRAGYDPVRGMIIGAWDYHGWLHVTPEATRSKR